MQKDSNKATQPEILAAAPRCLAKTRRGTECQSPAVRGKRRCRMHGGAKGSGAQLGNRNAWKHGQRSAGVQAELRKMRAMVKAAQALIAE